MSTHTGTSHNTKGEGWLIALNKTLTQWHSHSHKSLVITQTLGQTSVSYMWEINGLFHLNRWILRSIHLLTLKLQFNAELLGKHILLTKQFFGMNVSFHQNSIKLLTSFGGCILFFKEKDHLLSLTSTLWFTGSSYLTINLYI